MCTCTKNAGEEALASYRTQWQQTTLDTAVVMYGCHRSTWATAATVVDQPAPLCEMVTLCRHCTYTRDTHKPSSPAIHHALTLCNAHWGLCRHQTIPRAGHLAQAWGPDGFVMHDSLLQCSMAPEVGHASKMMPCKYNTKDISTQEACAWLPSSQGMRA